MRILATCDLHYNIPRSRLPTETVAAEICAAGGDVLLLLGDLAGMDLGILEHTFALFDGFRGAKLYVPGNHELWTQPGGDSMKRYREEIPAICRQFGVHPLDDGPFVSGDTAICGTVGWYDYSFRPPSLGIPERFYARKIAPGSASFRPAYRDLFAEPSDVPAHAEDIVCRWMDGEHVRMNVSDVEFCGLTNSRLREQLGSVAHCRNVVVGTHCLPFRDLIPAHSRSRSLLFATAFLGSASLGETIRAFPNVRRVFCGHNHHFAECRHGELHTTAIGSTYTHKRFETLDIV